MELKVHNYEERRVEINFPDIRIFIAESELIPLAQALEERRTFKTEYIHGVHAVYTTWLQSEQRVRLVYMMPKNRAVYDYVLTDNDIDAIVTALNEARDSDVIKQPPLEVNTYWDDHIKFHINQGLYASIYKVIKKRDVRRFSEMFRRPPAFGITHQRDFDSAQIFVTWNEDGSLQVGALQRRITGDATVSVSITPEEHADIVKRLSKY